MRLCVWFWLGNGRTGLARRRPVMRGVGVGFGLLDFCEAVRRVVALPAVTRPPREWPKRSIGGVAGLILALSEVEPTDAVAAVTPVDIAPPPAANPTSHT
jgi:hypothetical protein